MVAGRYRFRRKIAVMGIVLLGFGAGGGAAVRAQSALSTATVPRPAIERVSPRRCLQEGQRLSVYGRHFLPRAGRSLVLVSQSVRYTLAVQSWSAETIVATLPLQDKPHEAGDYEVVIAGLRGRILSNRDVRTAICVTAAVVADVPPSEPPPPEPPPPEQPPSEPAPREPAEPPAGGEPPAALVEPERARVPGRLSERPLPAFAGQASADAPAPGDAEPQEVMVWHRSMDEAKAFQKKVQAWSLRIKRRRKLDRLGMVVSVFRVPESVSVAEMISRLRQLDGTIVDANHRYVLEKGDERVVAQGKTYPQRLIRWVSRPRCGEGIRIGMVDTDIDMQHVALRGQAITRRSVLPSGVRAAAPDHATAIAAILVGDGRSETPGLLPRAGLSVAAVFRRRGKHATDTTAEWILYGLNWLLEQAVQVINLSLSGPDNRLLALAMKTVSEQNIPVVAAAGNGGPHGPPRYPAAYGGVLAVTAVDAGRRVYRKATRGGYVDLAAPGVEVWTAAPGNRGVYVSGTSYAAAYATAAAAVVRLRHRQWPAAKVRRLLLDRAEDLGPPGRDPIFGQGLMQAPSGCVA